MPDAICGRGPFGNASSVEPSYQSVGTPVAALFLRAMINLEREAPIGMSGLQIIREILDIDNRIGIWICSKSLLDWPQMTRDIKADPVEGIGNILKHIRGQAIKDRSYIHVGSKALTALVQCGCDFPALVRFGKGDRYLYPRQEDLINPVVDKERRFKGSHECHSRPPFKTSVHLISLQRDPENTG